MSLKRGDSGPEVEQLQLKLKAAGYNPGDVDGDFGPKTEDAVLAFQKERPELDDDKIAGPQTLGALDAAIVKIKPASGTPQPPANLVQCDEATWKQFEALVNTITKKPVRYGPGRGLWVDNRWMITYGAGQIGGTVKTWPNALGKPYPSFHCTSWCNFFMSWLCRRNQDYTHAGNIPAIWSLLLDSPDLHQNPGAGPYRGFGDVCYPITPDGSGAKRHGVPKVMDARELYDRRASLPTFIVFGQSTLRGGTWSWWHHTGLFVSRNGSLYRIAADGYKGSKGYSASSMEWTEVTPHDLAKFDNCVYRSYGVRTADGSYGDKSRPYSTVDFE